MKALKWDSLVNFKLYFGEAGSVLADDRLALDLTNPVSVLEATGSFTALAVPPDESTTRHEKQYFITQFYYHI